MAFTGNENQIYQYLHFNDDLHLFLITLTMFYELWKPSSYQRNLLKYDNEIPLTWRWLLGFCVAMRSSDLRSTHYWFNCTRHLAWCIACARLSAMFKKHCILFMKCITFRQHNKVRYHDHVLPRKWTFMEVIILSLETLHNGAAQGRELIFFAQYVDIRPAWAANGVFPRRSLFIIYIYIYIHICGFGEKLI